MWFVLVLMTALIFVLVRWYSLKRRFESLVQEGSHLKDRSIDFVANVSHELKTPLTSIVGYTETLESLMEKPSLTNDDRKQASYFLKRIQENTERLNRLIHDILELSRIEHPNTHLERSSFSPRDLFLEIQKRFAHRLEQRRQFLKVPSTNRLLMADRWLTEQAINNLVENAHRYCPEGSVIEILMDESDWEEDGRAYTRLTVADNGPGISQDDLSRIFERFYRAEKSRNRLLGGTGLGLAIVKHIMLSHGGFARAESRQGEGSRFSLYFPALKATSTGKSK